MSHDHFTHLKKLLQLEQAEELQRYESIGIDKSLREREKRGLALTGLSIINVSLSESGHTLIELERSEGGVLPFYSFDIGDGATLGLSKGVLPDKSNGVVYERTEKSVTLALPKPLPEYIEDSNQFFLIKSPNTVVYRYMHQALDEIIHTRDHVVAHFRDMSLGIKKALPSYSRDKHLTFINTQLNLTQKEAVAMTLANPQIALIHGPPGTGKTTVLVEIIAQAVKKGQQIFICAPSNAACDHLLKKVTDIGIDALRLGHPARIQESLRRFTMGHKAANHALAETLQFLNQELHLLNKRLMRSEDRHGSYDPRTKELYFERKNRRKEISQIKKQIERTILKDADVYIGTLTGVLNYSMIEKDFDLVVIDEATQAIEPLCWIPMLKTKKVVLAGDPKQLPATVLSTEAAEQGLDISLFERLQKLLDDDHKIMLTTQYRMNQLIMQFPSQQFYDNHLVADPLIENLCLKNLPGIITDNELTNTPFEFIDTAGKGYQEEIELGSESRFNTEEVQIILHLVKSLRDAGVKSDDIAVISPYGAQARRIKLHLKPEGIEVKTVDGFQGREKEVILLTCVRSNLQGELGFLSDLRRINVAITRAKKKLIIVGDSSTLSSLPFFDQLIKYAESIHGYKSIWEYF